MVGLIAPRTSISYRLYNPVQLNFNILAVASGSSCCAVQKKPQASRLLCMSRPPVLPSLKQARSVKQTSSCPADMSPVGTVRFQEVWQRLAAEDDEQTQVNNPPKRRAEDGEQKMPPPQVPNPPKTRRTGDAVSKEGVKECEKMLDDIGDWLNHAEYSDRGLALTRDNLDWLPLRPSPMAVDGEFNSPSTEEMRALGALEERWLDRAADEMREFGELEAMLE